MERYIRFWLTFICCFSISLGWTQNCVPTGLNQSNVSIKCDQTLGNFRFQVPDLRSPSNYTVITIPYEPFPFVTSGATTDNLLYEDDAYSNVFNLPFPFCFYGNVFDKAVISSNGFVTFDVTKKSECPNEGQAPYEVSNPLFFSKGGCTSNSYPSNSIFGVYMDLDPSIKTGVFANRKIEWRVEGTAPCRRFVVSFNDIASYGNTSCGTANGPTTFQIVMTESTGVIDVFIKNKQCNSIYPPNVFADRALLGIQGTNSSQFAAAPRKNATANWTSIQEGYRFVPTGGDSRFHSAELLNLDHSFVATVNSTANTTPGLLDLNFTNIATPANSNKYVLRTRFTSCSNAGTILEALDTITIQRSTVFNVSATTTNTLCGDPSGSITLNMPADTGLANFNYVFNSGLPIIGTGRSHTFNDVAAGTYSIEITDASGLCTTTLNNIVVGRTNNLAATITPTASACPTSNNGRIEVIPTTGKGPYSFQLDGGATVTHATSYTFQNVAPGNHTIIVIDASGCTTQALPVTVQSGTGLSGTVTSAATACPGVSNGRITVTPTNGTAPYTFTLSPGNIVVTGNTGVFNNVAAGNYTVTFRDAIDCETTAPISVTVTSGTNLLAQANTVATTCAGATNGEINVTPINGTAPYTFTLSPGNSTQNGATANFAGLSAGNYTITVMDNNGCTLASPIAANVATGANFTANTITTPTTCSGAANGTIAISPNGNSGPYTFILDGGALQTANGSYTYQNVTQGNHTVVVTNQYGCSTGNMTVTVGSGTVLTTTATPTHVLCAGTATGSIEVATPTVGTAPFEYSLDGTNWQSTRVFPNLAAGNYTIRIREANGCIGQTTATINQPVALQGSTTVTHVSCFGQNNGSLEILATGGTSPYQYSLNGTDWQTSRTFNALPPGNYTISIRDANLCITTVTAVINEPIVLAANITNITTATCDQRGTITVSAIGGTAPYEYSTNGITYQSAATLSENAGSHTVYVRDANRCVFSVPNIVVPFTNDLTYTPLTTATICEGGQTQLYLISNATQFSWSPSSSLSNSSIANPIASPTTTTQYQIELRKGVCTEIATAAVNVNPAPVAQVNADGIICIGQSYQLTGSGGVTYSWSPATYLDNVTIANPMATPEQTTTYNLVVTDALGCESINPASVTVGVTPPIEILASPFDTVVYPGAQFVITLESAATNYSWTPSNWISGGNNSQVTITAGQAGEIMNYHIVGTTAEGCRGETDVVVKVYEGPALYTPTAFSPNGDGANDLFFPFPVGIQNLNYFKVFNRWGEIIFQTKNLREGWNGKRNGIEQPAGVYIWMAEGVDDKGEKITKKGTVTLIR